MASATTSVAAEIRLDLADIPRIGFGRMLRVRGARRSPRIGCRDGGLTLLSPSRPHEPFAERCGPFVQGLTFGLDRPRNPLGSTTLVRKTSRAAVEADEAFYPANPDRIRGATDLDLERDPPPGLAVDVLITQGAKAAMEIDRRLGVPEVRVCSRTRPRIVPRGEDATDVASGSSRAFPSQKAAERFARIDQPPRVPIGAWPGRLRALVRDELAPRARGGERVQGG